MKTWLKARRRTVTLVWAAVIFVSGVVPIQTAVHVVASGREGLVTTLGHFVAYALLGGLLVASLCREGRSLRCLGFCLIVAAALGGLVELVQGPLPYRDAALGDFLADVAGAGLGLLLVSAVAPGVRRRSRRG